MLVLGALSGPSAVGQAPDAGPTRAAGGEEPGWSEVARQTQSRGIPTVLIVTSEAVPESRAAARSILDAKAAGPFAGRVGLAELCVEEDPEQAAKLQARTFPTFVAYRRGEGNRLAMVASYRGDLGPEGLAGWLHGIGLLSAEAPRPTVAATRDRDEEVSKAGLFHGHEPAPSPQQYAYPPPTPQYYPQPVPVPPTKYVPSPPVREVYAPPREVVREVVREAPPARRIVREAPREMVREVVVEREAPREVVREVVVEREAPAPRNLISRGVTERVVERAAPPPVEREVIIERAAPPPVEREVIVERAAPREVIVEREAPREVVVEREAPREVVVERAAPREVVVEREAPPVRVRAAEAAPELSLVQPGILDRVAGAFGERLRRRALPRVDVAVETQRTYRLARPAPAARMVAEPAYEIEEEPIVARVAKGHAPCRHGCRPGCPHDHGHGHAQQYAPPAAPQQPAYYPPPVSPQQPYYPPVPFNAPSPQNP
ncbi:hypothetical protein [Paludisphaera sp.]|uniref:hypothetical protein n=1 Tax=Paludisphaera sp. TaxID=2017432 RepID=UPI00301D4958